MEMGEPEAGSRIREEGHRNRLSGDAMHHLVPANGEQIFPLFLPHRMRQGTQHKNNQCFRVLIEWVVPGEDSN